MKKSAEREWSKSGQITIFIIIAIIIVAVLILLFYPRIQDFFISSPEMLIPTKCIESNVVQALNMTMLKGGSLNPSLNYLYENRTINYLCYTSEWYKVCTMQTPLLKQAIEAEVQKNASYAIKKCMLGMEERMRNKGYVVKVSGEETPIIKLEPNNIIVSFNMTLNLEKGEEKLTINPARFQTEIKSNSYDMIMVASSIQNFEARYGDSTPESYMNFYPNLRVEKKKQSDGTKVYIISDRDTMERLIFATRSLAWPPGYELNPVFENPSGTY
jgi:hypothetical protein